MNYVKLKVDSFDSLPLKETMTFCNVIILVKSVWKKIKITITIIFFFKK